MRGARPEPPEKEGEGAVKRRRFATTLASATGGSQIGTGTVGSLWVIHSLTPHISYQMTMETVTRKDSCPANLSFKRHNESTLSMSQFGIQFHFFILFCFSLSSTPHHHFKHVRISWDIFPNLPPFLIAREALTSSNFVVHEHG